MEPWRGAKTVCTYWMMPIPSAGASNPQVVLVRTTAWLIHLFVWPPVHASNPRQVNSKYYSPTSRLGVFVVNYCGHKGTKARSFLCISILPHSASVRSCFPDIDNGHQRTLAPC